MKMGLPTVEIIVAMSKNRAIGKNNSLLWHLPADLKFFKEKTTGHAIVMGRKTYESIGKPLPNRQNIIISKKSDYEAAGCIVVDSLEQALNQAKEQERIFVIGGAQIYQMAMEQAQRLWLTSVDTTVEGDAFFPEINLNQWEEVSRETWFKDDKNAYNYAFIQYAKSFKEK